MLIIGAGNLGKHVIDQLVQENYSGEIIFFDENSDKNLLYNKYKILNYWHELETYIHEEGKSFFIAIGHPRKRKQILDKIKSENNSTLISKHVGIVSEYSTIGKGSLIQPLCCISHNVKIGVSNIIHAATLIGHDVIIDDFVTIGSNVNILKGVEIGKYSIVGPNCLIMDNVKIGENVYIEPGVVVKRNIPNNTTIEYSFSAR